MIHFLLPPSPPDVQVLSDELVRMDAFLESVVKKVERQLFESFTAAAELAKASAKETSRTLASPPLPTLKVNDGKQGGRVV